MEIVIQEVLWSIRGSYSAIWSLPFTNVKRHSDHWPVTVTSQPIRLSTNFMTLILDLNLTELQVVSMKHSQRVLLAIRERLPFRTPDSVPPFGRLAYTPIVETSFTELAISFLDFSPWIPPVLSRFCFKNFSVSRCIMCVILTQFWQNTHHGLKM